MDQPEVDRYVATLHTQLDSGDIRGGVGRGERAMSLEQAIRYALGEDVA